MQRLLSVLMTVMLLAACSAPSAAPTAAPTNAPAALRTINVAMPFIPNVQFAAFYVAAEKGYYKDAGLEVKFDYNFETDVVQRVAQGTIDFAMAGGTSVLLARQQGLPIVTVATIYQAFPVVFMSKASQNIKTVADMKGKSVGIPGRFGDSYYALLAMLYANQLQEADLNIQEIGFTQAEALLTDKVQVTTGYAMNEPIKLTSEGQELNVIRVADLFPLASNGIIASEKMIAEQPEVVRAFVQATLRGLKDAIENSDTAFELSLKQIPEASLGDAEFQRTVLKEAIPFWYSEKTTQNGLGYTDADQWQQTETFMRDTKLLAGPVEVAKAFTNDFIK